MQSEITPRDLFAAAALSGFMAAWEPIYGENARLVDWEKLSERSFTAAEFMLAERNKKKD